MTRDFASTPGKDIAARITNLQKDEVQHFLRDHLRRRDLHEVVANLNETALSKDGLRAIEAREALQKLGFAD